jgi:6,7-dimethyl-8-ribityllumazine synthase
LVDGLMRAAMDTGVPVLSVPATPNRYQETDHHRSNFRVHFVKQDREAAEAALAIGRTRATPAA